MSSCVTSKQHETKATKFTLESRGHGDEMESIPGPREARHVIVFQLQMLVRSAHPQDLRSRCRRLETSTIT